MAVAAAVGEVIFDRSFIEISLDHVASLGRQVSSPATNMEGRTMCVYRLEVQRGDKEKDSRFIPETCVSYRQRRLLKPSGKCVSLKVLEKVQNK
jgi:hypothetical protein